MSKAREWPNVAKDARDLAAEAAQEALNQLEPLLDDKRVISQSELILRVSRAVVKLNRNLRLLESVGAQTRIV